MYLYYYNFNVMIIVTWDPTNEHNKSTVCWHVIKLHLTFVLFTGLMMDLFNSKHVAKASKKRIWVLFRLMVYIFFSFIKKYTHANSAFHTKFSFVLRYFVTMTINWNMNSYVNIDNIKYNVAPTKLRIIWT
jgi:hypothetical protein